MSVSSQLTNFPLLRGALSLRDIEVLIDRLPEALLLVNTRNKRIVLANSGAVELSAYTRAELQGMEFKLLFSGLGETSSWHKFMEEASDRELELVCRNKSRLVVQTKIAEFSPRSKWALVTLTPLSLIQQREAATHRVDQHLESLRILASAHQKPDLQSCLEQVIQAGLALTGATCLFIYQADGENPDLQCRASAGLGLPEQLPAQDLNLLKIPYLWKHGRRSLSVLHRTARTSQFSFLASAPLGQPNALIGLIAAAGEISSPKDNLLPLMQVLADTVTEKIQHYAQLSAMEETAREQRSSLKIHEVAQEAIQDGLIELSSDLHILRLNRSAESILGYRSAEVHGQPADYVLIGSEKIGPALTRGAHGIPTIGQGDVRLYRRSGQDFLAQVNTLPVLVEGELKGVVVLIHDLSEKEQIQVQAQQLEQRALLGEVTAVFAHEVRNPINNISTGLQLMALNLPGTDPNQEIIARLQADCDRLAELMKSVLSFSHPTEYEMEPVDIGLLLSRLLERLRPKIARANVRHNLQLEATNPLVQGNPRALEQVFTNLITNAIQAMGDQGGSLAIKIQTVKTTGRRRYIEISVTDSGPGITRENLEHIFQPFFTTKASGTGLGLAITKRIITAHKGTIRVNSFPVGTVFTVQLPETEQLASEPEPG